MNMTIKEAQNTFINALKEIGIKTSINVCFYNVKSKRLSSTGNIYAVMLKLSNENNQYTVQNMPISLETTKILDKYLNSFYYITKNRKINSNETLLTVFDDNFNIKIKLLGTIDDWWKKVYEEYHLEKRNTNA